MRCFVGNIVTEKDVVSDIKALVPDGAIRRRMSRILKMSVPAAVECAGGPDKLGDLDAIITATAFGCLADSEAFLRNMISGKEQLLNPTPFIQSTFNTAGGQVALLGGNNCYNMTYVNRSHSFEDALLDSMMKIEDAEASNVLVGAFDELTHSQYEIMSRMGAFRRYDYREGCIFAMLTAERTEKSVAQITGMSFFGAGCTEQAIIDGISSSDQADILRVDPQTYGVCPTSSAKAFADAVAMIKGGSREVIVINDMMRDKPVAIALRCIG